MIEVTDTIKGYEHFWQGLLRYFSLLCSSFTSCVKKPISVWSLIAKTNKNWLSFDDLHALHTIFSYLLPDKQSIINTTADLRR